MIQRCNEWDCPYNKDGKCTSEDCIKFEELMDFFYHWKDKEKDEKIKKTS